MASTKASSACGLRTSRHLANASRKWEFMGTQLGGGDLARRRELRWARGGDVRTDRGGEKPRRHAAEPPAKRASRLVLRAIGPGVTDAAICSGASLSDRSLG